MEAAVAEKEAGMTEWNDGRLDDLSQRVDRIETKMDAGFAQVHADMRELHVRFDGLQRTLIHIAWTFGIGVLAFASAFLGLIAVKF
jgi:hypothetical protein